MFLERLRTGGLWMSTALSPRTTVSLAGLVFATNSRLFGYKKLLPRNWPKGKLNFLHKIYARRRSTKRKWNRCPHNAEILCSDPSEARRASLEKRTREREREGEGEKTVAYNQARVVINQIVGGVMSLSACRATSDDARSSFDLARLRLINGRINAALTASLRHRRSAVSSLQNYLSSA